MNMVDLQNINFSYEKISVFSDFDMTFSGYSSYSIIGPNSCGKTTLLKIIANLVKYKGNVNFRSMDIRKRIDLDSKRNFVAIFDDDIFVRDTLREEMKFSLESIGVSPKTIISQINYLINEFDLQSIIDVPINNLEKKEQVIAKIMSYIIIKPEILALDDLFKWLDKSFKQKLINFLKENDIVLINIVSDIKDVLYTEYLFVLMSNGRIAIEGKTIPVLKEEKLIRRLGFDLPFMVDLSIQLGYYELVNKIYLDKEEMVNNIWK